MIQIVISCRFRGVLPGNRPVAIAMIDIDIYRSAAEQTGSYCGEPISFVIGVRAVPQVYTLCTT